MDQEAVSPIARAEHPIAAGTRIGHVHLRTADNTWKSAGGPPQPDGVTGLHHVAILYPTRADLADAVRRLQAVDWPLRQLADHGTHEAVYVSDPDGNDVELYWDRPEAEWPRDAAGHLAFAGGDLDLDDLLTA
jgi:catechol 2,3-dioxygenase